MIVILAVENHKDGLVSQLCEKYIQRISGPYKLQIQLIPAARVKDPAMQKDKESESFRKAIKPDDTIFLCDENGQTANSLVFSNLLKSQLSNMRGRMVFGIGGAYGFTLELLEQHTCIRLSDLTMPHHLARLVLVEQIYRAYEISRNTGYHHI